MLTQVSQIKRETLLVARPKEQLGSEVAFVSGFYRQFQQVETIFKKHWPILLKDQDLQSTISSKPKFIYRRAPGLRNE